MPITLEPTDDAYPTGANLTIAPENYQTQVVDTRKVEYDGLSTYIGGQKWACDYYAQVLGRDSSAASFQPDLPFAFGQYEVIRGFEIVVTSPLSTTQNSEGVRGFTSTGAGLVYSLVTPELGDVFIADIGNGRLGAVQITASRRVTMYPESPTEVEYRVTAYATAQFLNELNSRVVKTRIFSKENYRNGVKALLATEEVDILTRLSTAYFRLMNLYLRDFYSEKYHTLLVPGQQVATYDPMVVRFVKSILSTGDHPRVIDITELGVSHDVFSNELSVFDAIAAREVALLYSVSKKAGVASIANYRTYPWMNSIYYTGIRQVVSVMDVGFSVNHDHCLPYANLSLEHAGVRQPDIDSILPRLGLDGEEPIPTVGRFIKPVVVDDYYVFSRAFYDEDHNGELSMLERMVLDRLQGRAINLENLASMADYARKFDNLERFYYIPVILTLIKLAAGVL